MTGDLYNFSGNLYNNVVNTNGNVYTYSNTIYNTFLSTTNNYNHCEYNPFKFVLHCSVPIPSTPSAIILNFNNDSDVVELKEIKINDEDRKKWKVHNFIEINEEVEFIERFLAKEND